MFINRVFFSSLMNKNRKTIIYFSLLVLQVFLARFVYAGAVVLDSLGTVASGRGGANISHADNTAIMHDNPAGLVNMDAGIVIDGMLEFISTEIKYEDEAGFDYTKHEIFTLPSVSITYKKNEDSRFAFGAGAFVTAGFGTEYHQDHSARGFLPGRQISFGKQLYKSDASLTKLLFSVSYKATSKLSLGVSFGPARHTVNFESPYTFQDGLFSGLSAIADMRNNSGLGYSFTTGVQYKLSDKTVVGLSFISESKTTLKGDGNIIIPDTSPLKRLFRNQKGEYDLKTNFEWPREIGFGISHILGESHKFAVELVWFNYSSAYDRADLELTEGNNREFNRLLGPTVNDSFPFNWENVLAYRFGYEFLLGGERDNVFRFGYIFNENPIPSSTLVPLIPGTLKHNFTLGYTHRRGNIDFNIASQFSVADPESVGKSSIVGGDFDNSTLKTKAYLLLLGITYRL